MAYEVQYDCNMTATNITASVLAAKSMSTSDLRHVRATIEAEMIAAMANGVVGTQAHIGQIELMEACASELASRNATTAVHPIMVHEVSHEACVDGVNMELSYAVRTF